MTRIDDDMLMAFADGELEPDRRALVEAALTSDPSLRKRVESHQRLRARISAHYAPIADEEVPDRFTALLSVPAATGENVLPLARAQERRARPVWHGLTALAATLVVGLFAGTMISRSGDPPFGFDQGRMVARGPLADALESRLASEADGDNRIGVTFAAVDGRVCRTFNSTALSGLACRGEVGWRIEAVAAAANGDASGGEFRQASSSNPLVLAAAQELMAGEPFNAEAERRARAIGWRNPRARD